MKFHATITLHIRVPLESGVLILKSPELSLSFAQIVNFMGSSSFHEGNRKSLPIEKADVSTSSGISLVFHKNLCFIFYMSC